MQLWKLWSAFSKLMNEVKLLGYGERNLRVMETHIYRKATQGNGMREMENKQERSHVGTKEHFNVFNVFSM